MLSNVLHHLVAMRPVDATTIAQLISESGCINICQPRFIIGRNPRADLVVSDARVSGEHAVIELNDDACVYLTDISRNGVRINGLRLNKKDPVELKHK